MFNIEHFRRTLGKEGNNREREGERETSKIGLIRHWPEVHEIYDVSPCSQVDNIILSSIYQLLLVSTTSTSPSAGLCPNL